MRLSVLCVLALLPGLASADPPGPPPACGISIQQLFCYRITQVRKLASDPQGDAWEVMFQFVNWTNQDVVGIDVAMNVGGLVQTQGRAPYFADARIDVDGRPFGPGAIRPAGNADLDNDWNVPVVAPQRLRYATRAPGQPDGTPIPHPTVPGTVSGVPTVYDGIYDPQFADSSLVECGDALTAMIPGSSRSGATLNTNARSLDDGDNVRDGFVVVLDDFDPGETVSFNWVLLVGDGQEISGYVDASGTIQGDPMGFGTFSLSLYPNGLPAEPIFNVNAGFDPSDAFDPDQDSEFLWAEDELGGIDQYQVNPVPPGQPGQGEYVGIEMGAAVTAPFIQPTAASDSGNFTFANQPVSMADNIVPTVPVDPFDIVAPSFVLPGDPLELRATGATPGDTVWFLFGPRQGNGPCPPPLLGDCLPLVGAQAFGNATADATGEATFSLQVPGNLPLGLSTLVQAVGIRSSAASGQQPGDNYQSDLVSITLGVDPACPDDDQDGLCNAVDLCLGDNSFGDADGDGICGALDADADGLYDTLEVMLGTSPDDADTDGDGLADGVEVLIYGTDPLLLDTDGGGTDDFTEVSVDGTNPVDGIDDLGVSLLDACTDVNYCNRLSAGSTWTGAPSFLLTSLQGARVGITASWEDVTAFQCNGSSQDVSVSAAVDPGFDVQVTASTPIARAWLDSVDWSLAELTTSFTPAGASTTLVVPGVVSVDGLFGTDVDWPSCGTRDVSASGALTVTDLQTTDTVDTTADVAATQPP